MLHPSAKDDVRRILWMVVAIVLPTWATLETVRVPVSGLVSEPNPTPHGYTVSLGLFLMPTLLIAAWHARHPEHRFSRRALLRSAVLIALAGTLLDVALSHEFFRFDNVLATAGIRAPAWDFGAHNFAAAYIPIEEFAFYVLGGLFVASIYSWADCDWLTDYNSKAYAQLAVSRARLLQVSGGAVLLWLGITLIGVAFRWLSPGPAGTPWYFLFLMCLGFLPSFAFVKNLREFVNWRAFAFAYAALILVALVWEVTLGVPYDWWNYQHQHMLGIYINAWSGLPIEAVLVWLVVAWDAILAFEFFRVALHMDRPTRRVLFGNRSASA